MLALVASIHDFFHRSPNEKVVDRRHKADHDDGACGVLGRLPVSFLL
jgi:hypothetical protein